MLELTLLGSTFQQLFRARTTCYWHPVLRIVHEETYNKTYSVSHVSCGVSGVTGVLKEI